MKKNAAPAVKIVNSKNDDTQQTWYIESMLAQPLQRWNIIL